MMKTQFSSERYKCLCLSRHEIIAAKGMLHQGLKVKKLNNISNFKSVVSELCRIS